MASRDNPLGTFLRERRARLDPADFGFATVRRRTPGLRREEVAQRAHMSATWYTWLEQGRGGAPSADALDRVSAALALTAAEREHLFLLAHGRPPEVQNPPPGAVTGRLQRVLDAMPGCPAFVKTSAWDVIAWNRAAAAVLTDYGALPPGDRNILRLVFDPDRAATMPDWEHTARQVVATFRLETARAGATARAAALVDDLRQSSAAFAELWDQGDVSAHGEGTKRVRHPGGTVVLDYSTFAADDESDLGLVVYTPATARDAEWVRALVAASDAGASVGAAR